MRTTTLLLMLAAATVARADDAPTKKPPIAPAPPSLVPKRFLQMRETMAELYPDAEHLPVIWDADHDPFRYGYEVPDDAGEKTGTDGWAPAAPAKHDLDTESLMEAGLDVVTGKTHAPGASAGAAPVVRSAEEKIPQSDAELLKRAVAKLKVGGVFVMRGLSKIMVDSVARKEGDVVTVSVAGRRVNVLISHLGDNRVIFVLQGQGTKGPTVTVNY